MQGQRWEAEQTNLHRMEQLRPEPLHPTGGHQEHSAAQTALATLAQSLGRASGAYPEIHQSGAGWQLCDWRRPQSAGQVPHEACQRHGGGGCILQ